MVDPPRRQHPLAGLQVAAADLPINETPLLAEVREAVKTFKGICNVSAEILKAVSEAMSHGLHGVLSAV